MIHRKHCIAPSVLSVDFTCLKQQIQQVEDAGADCMHVDIMDGHFVPNLSMGPAMVKALQRCTQLPLDVHLMVREPDRWIDPFQQAGAHSITVHMEACTHIQRTLSYIGQVGCKAGVALNPATSEESLHYLLADIDTVLVMTVNPGFGGQSFLTNQLKKIERLRALLDHNQAQEVTIAVDGGINTQTAVQAAQAGANLFVAGHAIFASSDPGQALKQLRQALELAGHNR
ncbi:MAG: ribulose-phosphate 3-epimerase [Myxococcota bacterium]